MNRKYEKPTLFASRVSGEGVYLASGAGTRYTLSRVQNEPTEFYPTARYQIVFTDLPSSSGQFAQEADVILHVHGANVTSVAAEANCTVAMKHNSIEVHLKSFNNIAQIAVTCDKHTFTVS